MMRLLGDTELTPSPLTRGAVPALEGRGGGRAKSLAVAGHHAGLAHSGHSTSFALIATRSEAAQPGTDVGPDQDQRRGRGRGQFQGRGKGRRQGHARCGCSPPGKGRSRSRASQM